ncbi:MAG: hypothetical protein ACM3WV_09345 [Bacillota bacterium]
MRKLLSISAAAILGVLCFSQAVLGGFSLYGDYTFTSLNLSGGSIKVNFLNLASEYKADLFCLGGFYAFSAALDPEPVDPFEVNYGFYGFYGGYNIENDETYRLDILSGYYYYRWKGVRDDTGTPIPFTAECVSLAMGFRIEAGMGGFSGLVTFLSGVYTDFRYKESGLSFESFDPGFSLLEMKGVYAFTRAWNILLVYRTCHATSHFSDCGCTGFGLGMQINF